MIRLSGERDVIKVVNDQTGSPTYASDLAHAILQIITGVNNHQIAFNAGIYHYSNEGHCTWYEFACAIKEEYGFATPVEPVGSKDFPTAASRPQYSVLSKVRIAENYRIAIPHWRTSLNKCIQLIKNK
jgi:dTDP-4-dehydrorhamnose reductase